MRILFIHHAGYLEIGIPGGVAVLSALLREHGHDVRLFDTTFLKPTHYQKSVKAGPAIYKETAYSLEDLVEHDPVVDLNEEFARVIKEYQPHLVAASAMTTNIDGTLEILREADPDCLVVLGGVHPTLQPEEILAEDVVDVVCVGEGEGALVDLCSALEKGKDTAEIANLCFRDNGEIVKNPLRRFENLDELPVPDWSIFDERHLFRPFQGEIYQGSFITTSRGCPEGCTYCVNKALRQICSGCGGYFRRQSPAKTVLDLQILKQMYGTTWFKFADDTFLLHSVEELEALREGLDELGFAFGCSVQPSTISDKKVALAGEMGCVAMTVGIESGNEEIRRKILNRRISNHNLENAIRTIIDADIRVSTFNMIGLPGETRENVFETIRFNKKLGIKAANVYILYPFPGTEISRAHDTDYRDSDGKVIPMSAASGFSISRMSREELEGLRKTFNLYLLLPETYWGRIREAEGQSESSRQILYELEELAATYV